MNQSIQPYGLIYKITNLQTKKIYIGQTTKLNRFDTYYGSGNAIYQSVKKHGKEFFKKEILGYCYSQKELNECEKVCIEFFNSQNRIYGYNISEGGLNGPIAEETKKKISNTLKGNKLSDETKKKLSESHKGKKFSNEHKQNLSIKAKGNKNGSVPCSEEKKQKISQANKGQKHSQESIDKMRANLKGKRKGIKFSDEHKEKMRIAALNRKKKEVTMTS